MQHDRRDFIKNIAWGIGAGSLASCKTTGQLSLDEESVLLSAPINNRIPKRVNWTSLPEADKRAFLEAVRAMNQRNVSVPASFSGQSTRQVRLWEAQAMSHRFHCEHANWFFLPWHRAYLYFFELQLRHLIRDSFRLPYWDWTENSQLPPELVSPELVNSLSLDRSTTSILSDFESQDWWTAARSTLLSQPDFDSIGGDRNSSGELESPYHNTVHVNIGGKMSIVADAGSDPIFWLHHCNVDRLWSLWMDRIIASGRKRRLFPSRDVQPWLNRSFDNQFWSPGNKLRSMRVRAALFTEDLGYNYDTMKMTWQIQDIPRNKKVKEVKLPVKPEPLSLTAPKPKQSLTLDFTLPESLMDVIDEVISLRFKIKGLPTPKDSRVRYRLTLALGETKIKLPEIVNFSAQHEQHGQHTPQEERYWGFVLREHLEVIRRESELTKEGKIIIEIVSPAKIPDILEAARVQLQTEKDGIELQFCTVYDRPEL